MLGLSLNAKQLDRCLRIWLAVSAIALIGSTYPLWFPIAANPFPQIPLTQAALNAPLWFDWIASAVLLMAWLLFACSRLRIFSVWLLVSAGLATVVLDQHRLQPWHYQLIVSASLIAQAPPTDSRLCQKWLSLLRVFTISIYIYSAISKFDYEFLHTVGAQMLQTAFAWIAVDGSPTPAAVAMLPAGELLLGFLLCWSKTRRVGGMLACIFHVGLIILLSPVGLNHSWGVLLWNLHFIGLSWLLFLQFKAKKEVSEANSSSLPPTAIISLTKQRLAALGILLLVVTLPLFERTGLWDHWPSWALYAPHSSRVRIQVASNYLDRLPTDLQAHITDLSDTRPETQLWTYLPIDKWSLQSCYAPVYPQARFQLGLASYLAAEVGSEFGVRAELLGPASRLDGQRTRKILDTRKEIEAARHLFFLNTIPRTSSR